MSECEPNDVVLSRRAFLKAGIGAAIGASINQRPAEAKATGIETDAPHIFEEQFLRKLIFPEHFEQPTVEVKHLIAELDRMNSVLDTEMALLPKGGSEDDTTQKLQQAIERRRQALWPLFQKLLGKKDEYSLTKYYEVIAFDIPQLLVQYGIVVTPAPHVISDKETDALILNLEKYAFYASDHVERTQVTQYGKSFERDIVTVRGPLLDPLHPELGTDNKDKSAMFESYQTVFWDKEYFEERTEAIHKQFKELAAQVPANTDEQIFTAIQTGAEQDHLVSGVVLGRILRSLLKKGNFRERHHNAVLAHETRHSFDKRYKVFPSALLGEKTNLGSDFLRQKINSGVHKEINGELGALRCSPDKEFTVLQMVAEGSQDPEHDYATQWIREQLFEELVKNGKDYGVTITAQSPLTPRNQVLLALPRLLEQPQVLERLADTLFLVHEKQYGRDLSRISMRSKTDTRTVSPTERIFEIGLGTTLVAGASLLAIREIVRRRNLNLLELQLRTVLPKTKDLERLINDLQLLTARKKVDHVKRRAAIKELERRGRKNKNIEVVVEKIKAVVGDPQK